MANDLQTPLLEYLRHKLAIPTDALKMAVKFTEASMGSLPMVLWQYGLIDLQQLDEVLDWIDKRDINDVELSY
ncbi:MULTISPECIES: DUF2949 domain-containing protein [Crocosphaera]|uniref:DUF2949 domain-containing protein n=2 Tax=Crocosphaera watsonii TaxID=263511 RepID=G5JAI3_CROWT|nr:MULTISPECIES: DUF2949 domain-containing protein [Crocosphaera]EHJ10802.1 hypothetical protein CWATWH0003_4446 [Crocosphaera watsonii WH 0003]MCH2246664.1 DUF2949 domain-containing protein [Crocosphaera sp.]NQZ62429.1 DUF2949 domain-containing protein [Crocosphaera sp.]CCQ58872.1 Asl4748 protein [Crocosphaera watsonii WH 0005]